jgi:type IV secretory pathway TrbF-like protein
MDMDCQKLDFKPQGEPESPYYRAKQEFDDLIGNARVRAKNWRMAFFACAGLAALLGLGVIIVSTQARVTPYIVEVDTTGSVKLVGKAVATNYRPTTAAIKHFLGRFVTNIRSVPTDPIVMRKSFLEAYNFVTAKGRNTLNAYAVEQDPFSKLGDTAVSVEISSVSAISDNSYQVQWSEQAFGRNGVLVESVRYTGIFNITIQEPTTEKMILSNPLGLFIDFFSLSQELS